MTSAFSRALALIDAANAQDPNQVPNADGVLVPKERLYSDRMSECIAQFVPDASEHLQLAARAQHIERWTSPRSDFPSGRAGYNQWRTSLGRYHAKRCAEIMEEVGYGEEDIDRVKRLLMKRGIKSNPECQTLENVICLVFLEHYLDDFAKKHQDDKVIDIIRKTWAKMSYEGHQQALSMDFPDHLASLIHAALETD